MSISQKNINYNYIEYPSYSALCSFLIKFTQDGEDIIKVGWPENSLPHLQSIQISKS